VLPVKDPLHAAHATRQVFSTVRLHLCQVYDCCHLLQVAPAADDIAQDKMNMSSALLDPPVLKGAAETSEAMDKRRGRGPT
jgi:hypothetical protein